MTAKAILLALLLVLTAACTETEWCDSRAAKQLRERNVSTMYYETVKEFLAATPDEPIALFAHRGGYHCEQQDDAPENSFPNIEKAVRMGFDGYETDLWATKDGEFLIHHDETLDRTTTGSGEIAAVTLEEARKLRLKYPSGNVSKEQIPTYRELLVAGGGRILFLIELKGGTAERLPELVKIARDVNSLDKVIFWIDWSPEYAVLLQQYLDAGMIEARDNVLWRTRDMAALEDVIEKFDPAMVDIPPEQEELSEAKSYRTYIFGQLPKAHLSLVIAARQNGVKVHVSKVTTNGYLRGLKSHGVRAFMSRAPEVQLAYLVKKGWHQ